MAWLALALTPALETPTLCAQEVEKDKSTALVGSLLWQTPQGMLVGASLPAVAGVPEEDEEEEDEELEEAVREEEGGSEGGSNGEVGHGSQGVH